MNAWICPKCGRVYAGATPECYVCNQRIAEIEESRKLTDVIDIIKQTKQGELK